MDIKEMGKTIISMVKENKEIVEDMWESIPSDMQVKIKEEIEKVKRQISEYKSNKEEQTD